MSDTEGNLKKDITTVLNEDEEAIYYTDRYGKYTYLIKCYEGYKFIYV
jgi:hypothetical protein